MKKTQRVKMLVSYWITISNWVTPIPDVNGLLLLERLVGAGTQVHLLHLLDRIVVFITKVCILILQGGVSSTGCPPDRSLSDSHDGASAPTKIVAITIKITDERHNVRKLL